MPEQSLIVCIAALLEKVEFFEGSLKVTTHLSWSPTHPLEVHRSKTTPARLRAITTIFRSTYSLLCMVSSTDDLCQIQLILLQTSFILWMYRTRGTSVQPNSIVIPSRTTVITAADIVIPTMYK
jgi:hypothetical protein